MTSIMVPGNMGGSGPAPVQAAYRRLTSDMTDERGVIPKALLQYPELAELEQQRQRLVAAWMEAHHSGKTYMSDAEYVAARAKALRHGTEMPAPPPTQATIDANRQRVARDVAAAEAALMQLADDICDTLREHPEFEQDGRERIASLHERAAEMRRVAAEAEREAERAGFLVKWLQFAAQDELFVLTTPV